MNPHHAAARFGFGLAPGELDPIGEDVEGWLLGQLDAEDGGDPGPTSRDVITQHVSMQGMRKDRRRDDRDAYHRGSQSYLTHVASSEQPFRERLVAFWANHFCVSVVRKEVLALVGPYVREAIRPHVTGRFADLLTAVVRHPAMLLYLDNGASIGPDSMAGQRRGRGLNENLAREILELHTLGVNGGYTQGDVEAFAQILTGWTVDRKSRGGAPFVFLRGRHQPGAKTLLGKRYREAGEQEGLDALQDLAMHPSTARFVCTKLARHFVDDAPARAVVDALVAVWMSTDGDLLQVTRALVRHPAAWERPFAKLRTPMELVLAGARVLGWAWEGAAMATSLEMLGQPWFQAPSPQGWSDHADDWLGPDAMLSRLEWAELLAEQSVERVDLDLVESLILGPDASPRTHRVVSQAASDTEALALLIASPEFQRR